MPHCHDMLMGQIWRCKCCGLELKVVKQCSDCEDESKGSCSDNCTGFDCCGEEMELKE